MEQLKILIIEDEIIIATVTKRTLKNLGYEVTAIVDTGEKAIKTIEANKPDLVLMDIQITGKPDGIETVSAIHSRFNIPIVFTVDDLDLASIKRVRMTVPFSYVLKPIRKRDLILVIDMTLYDSRVEAEKKQIEKAFLESQKKYETIVKTSPNAVCVSQFDGTYVEINEVYTKFTGYSKEDLIGRSRVKMNMWVKQEDREKFLTELKKNNHIENLESKFRCKDGSIKTGLVSGRIIILNDVPHVLTVTHDISDRKLMEESLTKARNELEQTVLIRTKALQQEIEERKQIEVYLLESRKEAEQANIAKSEFLSNISHEIRTPMHQILSFAKFGVGKIDKVKKEKLYHYFSKIETIGKNLLTLLNDLLDLSKIEAGELDYDMHKSDLKQMICNVSNEFVSLLEEKGLTLNIVENNNQIEMVCDEGRIGQVVRNLLSNAIKFTPPQKNITIFIENGNLPAGKRQTDASTIPALLVRITDQGIGIPENELDSIFDKFIQSSKTKTGAGGTGLGLAICKDIINAHNGKIWAENNQDRGSTFSFILPHEQKAG